jgi:hypothetical protein
MNTDMSAEKMQQFKAAAMKAAGMDCIGGVPVKGVDADWFYAQLVEAVEEFPEILEWDTQRIQTLSQGLYLLDAEDLMTCI